MRAVGGIPDRIRVEVIGSDIVALDPDRGIVHRIAPLEAQMLAAGHVEPFLASLGAEVTEAVVTALSVRRWDRRTLLGSGSALVAAGVTTLLLPSAVAAASLFDANIGSLGGFEDGAATFTSVEGSAIDDTNPKFIEASGFTVNARAHGRWTIPTGVTRIQIVAYSTSGTTAFALDSSTEPSPFTGQPGRGVQAVGTFDLPDAGTRYLGIYFSGSQRWASNETPSGGYGASAVGATFINDAGTVEWLLVAGGGGGAGDARTLRPLTGDPQYLDASPPGTTHVGGNGGDAGTGGAAKAGGGGTADGVVDGRGGGGGTLSAVGAKGEGGSGVDGFAGNPSYADRFMSNSNAFVNSLGRGGGQSNTFSLPGGNGGGGFFGGGGGEAGSSGGGRAGGGGGGGSSMLNATYLDTSAASRLMLTNRSYSLGPTISLYW